MSAEPATPGSPSATTVLLVHPDVKFLVKYQTLLEQCGFNVLAANDGSEGLKKLYQHRPQLIVADIILPEINGYQICRLLKNDPATRNIPFILISDFSEKIEKFWGIRAGADLFLNYNELDIKLVEQVRILLEMYGQGAQFAGDMPSNLPITTDTSTVGMMTRLNQILDKTLIESTLMIEFRNLMDLAYEASLLNHMLVSFLEDIIDYDALAIFYNDKNKVPRLLTIHLPDGQTLSPKQLEEMKLGFFSSLPEVYRDLPLFRMQELDVIGLNDEQAENVEFTTVYPKFFFDKNDMIGAVVVYAKEKVDYANIFPMALVEDELSLLMKIRNVFSQSELLAISDSLTGLMNYNQFMLILDREFKAAKRYGNPLSIAIIDIDNFKEYNARWGYLQGDEVLRLVAKEAEETFRAVDVIARLGGEELAVIFPKTDDASALQALDRFKENVSQLVGTLSPITASIGLAGLTEDTADTSAFLSMARDVLEKNASRVSS